MTLNAGYKFQGESTSTDTSHPLLGPASDYWQGHRHLPLRPGAVRLTLPSRAATLAAPADRCARTDYVVG